MRQDQQLECQGLEAGVTLGAGRPDLRVKGRTSYRLSWDRGGAATRGDAGTRLDVEIAEGVTRFTVQGLDGPAAVVCPASWEVERHWRRLLYTGVVAYLPEWWARSIYGGANDASSVQEVPAPPAAKPDQAPRPPGMHHLSPRPRRHYPRIRMEGGAILSVRRGKGQELTYGPDLSISVRDDYVRRDRRGAAGDGH